MPDQNEYRLSAIGQIAVPVKDIARAEKFYREQLGVKHLFTVPGRMAFFDCAGVRLMLDVPEDGGEHHSSVIYYHIGKDIHAAYNALRERGVSFDDEPHLIAPMPDHDLWMAFFRDSENNLLAIMAEVQRG